MGVLNEKRCKYFLKIPMLKTGKDYFKVLARKEGSQGNLGSLLLRVQIGGIK